MFANFIGSAAPLQLGLFLLVLLALAWPLGAYIARVMQGDNVGPCACSRRWSAAFTGWPASSRTKTWAGAATPSPCCCSMC